MDPNGPRVGAEGIDLLTVWADVHVRDAVRTRCPCFGDGVLVRLEVLGVDAPLVRLAQVPHLDKAS